MSTSHVSGRGVLRAVLSPRSLVAFSIAGLCLWALFSKLGPIDIDAVQTSLSDISLGRWALAAGLTCLSFLAIGQYDALFHRWLKTGVSNTRARFCGASAIALSQTLGLGLLTGTLTRWRLLPELTIGQSLKITNYVAFTFMVALGLVSAVALTFAPFAGTTGTWCFATIACGTTLVAMILSVLRPNWLPIALPPLKLMLRITLLTALDVAFAGAALWVLLPNTATLDLSAFLAAFAVALGAGLLSGAPGGVGPFELCLIALLPMIPEAELMAGILAFRLIYYAVPACLAFVALARPVAPKPKERYRQDPALPLVRAEPLGLARQAERALLAEGPRRYFAAETSQALVAIGDPATGGAYTAKSLENLSNRAERRGLGPALYKISKESAVAARRAGWTVAALSQEAWLNPAQFSSDGSERRQLRRKLRQAEKAGVSVSEPAALPLFEMENVAQGWAERCGGERGFSMGRFTPEHVSAQRCFIAMQADRLVAFATFHSTEGEWVLDLMRSTEDMPDGTMHALVHEALIAAKAEGVERLSLAAMPLANPTGLTRALPDHGGLRRFKLSFAPQLAPLYIAAPGPLQLGIAALDIALRIQNPNSDSVSFKFSALQKLQGGVSGLSVVSNASGPHMIAVTEPQHSKELSS